MAFLKFMLLNAEHIWFLRLPHVSWACAVVVTSMSASIVSRFLTAARRPFTFQDRILNPPSHNSGLGVGSRGGPIDLAFFSEGFLVNPPSLLLRFTELAFYIMASMLGFQT